MRNLKPERNSFFTAMLLRRELGADAIHLYVDAGVPAIKK
jgi:hypothetical protein